MKAPELVSDGRIFFSFVTYFIFFSYLATEASVSHYALVEFEEEECTAVVPFQRISSSSSDVGTFRRVDLVKVLWNDKREYSAKFILSGLLRFLFNAQSNYSIEY